LLRGTRLVFNPHKRRFDLGGAPPLYPPGHDVAASACHPPDNMTACRMLADLDDIATISGATPNPFAGVPYAGSWVVPPSISDGDYMVFIEVNKQYDNDAPT